MIAFNIVILYYASQCIHGEFIFTFCISYFVYKMVKTCLTKWQIILTYSNVFVLQCVFILMVLSAHIVLARGLQLVPDGSWLLGGYM